MSLNGELCGDERSIMRRPEYFVLATPIALTRKNVKGRNGKGADHEVFIHLFFY